jgi:hypothetical protein
MSIAPRDVQRHVTTMTGDGYEPDSSSRRALSDVWEKAATTSK